MSPGPLFFPDAANWEQWNRTRRDDRPQGRNDSWDGWDSENCASEAGVLRTSDSVRSIRLLFSSVRFSEDLFSSSPSPSSLNTLTSSVLPRSSPPLDETCGMVHSRRCITACYMAQLPSPHHTHYTITPPGIHHRPSTRASMGETIN